MLFYTDWCEVCTNVPSLKWVRSLSHNLLISNTDWKTNTTTRRMKTTNKLQSGSVQISQVPAPGPAPASCHLHINNKQCCLAAGEGVN